MSNEIKTGEHIGPEARSTAVVLAPHRIDYDQFANYFNSLGVTTGTNKPFSKEGIVRTTQNEGIYAVQRLGEEFKKIGDFIPETSVKLAQDILRKKQWPKKSIDAIYYCGSYPFGYNVAQLVSCEIGAGNAYTQDVYAGCASSAIALDLATKITPKGARVLIVGAEYYSQSISRDNPDSTLFTDGGAAFGFENGVDFEVEQALQAYEYDPKIMLPIKPELLPERSTYYEIPISQDYFQMDGPAVLRWVEEGSPIELTLQAYKEIADRKSDDDSRTYIIHHPGSGRASNGFRKSLIKRDVRAEIPQGPVSQIGNLGAASLLAELDHLLKNYTINQGDNLIIAGYGAGLITKVLRLAIKRTLS